MKKMAFLAGILALVFTMALFTSCVSTHPLLATSGGDSEIILKTGKANSFSLLSGLIHWGNGGIDKAKISGNITNVSSVDVKKFSLLAGSLFQMQTTIVRGN